MKVVVEFDFGVWNKDTPKIKAAFEIWIILLISGL